MKKLTTKILSAIPLFLFATTFSIAQENKIVTYPAPATEKINSSYTVLVNGKPLDIYKALSPQFQGGEYYFASFDFEGGVEVEIKSSKPLDKAELFPAKFKAVKKSKNSLKFTVDKPPFNVSILREERDMPLIVFGNPIEKNIPQAGDKNVVYFGAGVHTLPKIELKDNQTLYLAGGAVVKSKIVAEGKNITIRGRGILSGDLSERFVGGCLAHFKNCENLSVEGVIFKDSPSWTFVTQNCKNVTVDNVKICCSRMLNDDAIDLCNTSNVKIKNVFARAQDDIIAIKGMGGNMPCENIDISDCVFWTDIANIFRIGYECESEAMRNIKAKNIDIPFYAVNYRGPEEYWAKGIIWLQASNNMPMHDIHFENISVRSNGNDMCMLLANPRKIKTRFHSNQDKAGRVFDCSLKNIEVKGKRGKFKGLIYFKGDDELHGVKNIRLENINYFGEKIGEDSKCFADEKIFTDGISIK